MSRAAEISAASLPKPARPVAANKSVAVGALTIVMTLVGWSSIPLFITHFADKLDVWTSNGWRYGFSALLWAPVLVAAKVQNRSPRGLWKAAILPAVFNAFGQTAFTWSYYKTDPTSATFGLRAQIVFVAVGAYMLFPSERLVLRRPLSWCGIALVLAGITGTIFLAPGARSALETQALGVGLALTGGLLFAGYALAVRKYMHGFHPVTAFAAISQFTALICVAMMLAFGHDGQTHVYDAGKSPWLLPTGEFGLLLLSAIIGIALGHVFYYIAIARLGVAVSSAILQLQPFLVAIGAHWVLSKEITTGQITAGCVAVCGALMLLSVQWSLSRAAKAAQGQVLPPTNTEESDMELAEPAAADCATDQ